MYAGFLFYLSSLSQPSVPEFPLSDKIYHLGLYAGLGFLLARATRGSSTAWTGKKLLMAAFLGASLYGTTDEIHQIFVPQRSWEMLDLMMDGAGGFLGGGVYLIRFRYGESNYRCGKIL